MRCTLIIPTYNRPDQLRQQLVFCASLHRDFALRVADGSDAEAASANHRAVEDTDHPDIQWRHFPDTHLWQRAVTLLAECRTPYSMLCADDDFLMPEGASAALDFLEAHADYASAQGTTIGLPGPSAFGMVTWCLNSLLGRLDAESPAERMAHHLTAYSHTCYAIHRTSVLQESLRLASAPPFSMDTICLGELAQSIHTVLAGKSAWLDVPGLCRSPSTSSWPAALELVRPEFSECIAAIRDLAARYAVDAPLENVRQLLNQTLSTNLASRRIALTSAEYDFWTWQSSRHSRLKKPDLYAAVKQLKSGTAWKTLVSCYPAAAKPIKRRSLKSWLKSFRRA